jgi:predicted TIM-barrel fold metal-dependent hydrolase
MSALKIEYRQQDKSIYMERIKPFLPERLFDAHAHLMLDRAHVDLFKSNPISAGAGLHDIDADKLEQWWKTLLEGIPVSGMLMGYPTKGCDLRAINVFVAKEAARKDYPFAWLVSPELKVEQLEADIRKYSPAALKPYMVFVDRPDYGNCRITDMLPEEQIELANEYRLNVILHVARPRGMADELNLRDIDRLSELYPNCRFVLAHCGRCFIGMNAGEMLKVLPQRDNVWVDTSAVCDPIVFIHLFREFRMDRIVFGSDLVTAAGFRGSYVSFADSWKLYQDEECTFELYENLCALTAAVELIGLDESRLEDVFYNNAARLFDIKD